MSLTSWMCGLFSLFMVLALVLIGGVLLFKLGKVLLAPQAKPTAGPAATTAGGPINLDDPALQQAVLRRMAAPSHEETTADLLKQVAAKKLPTPTA